MRALFLLLTCVVASCSSDSDQPLTVRQFHLRDTDPTHRDAMMVRGEQQYHLRGAVTLEERQNRLGQYYTVSWNNTSGQPTQIVMDYQQAATGAKILRKTHRLPMKKSLGKVEFSVTGSDYQQNGRVLAWRIRLMGGNKVLSEKRSYLWK